MTVTLPWRPRDTAKARSGETYGEKSTCTGQHVVNVDTHLGSRRGGRATQGEAAQEEEVRKTRVEGAPDATGEAGRMEQWEGDGGPPPIYNTTGLCLCLRGVGLIDGGKADLQGFITARSHLSLQEVYADFPHQHYRTNLSGQVPDKATWEIHWRWLGAQ